jgi:hypothetical protein
MTIAHFICVVFSFIKKQVMGIEKFWMLKFSGWLKPLLDRIAQDKTRMFLSDKNGFMFQAALRKK